MPRAKQSNTNTETIMPLTVKKLKSQLDTLQKKIDTLEENKKRESDDVVMLSKDKMIELLSILTHCMKKEKSGDDGYEEIHPTVASTQKQQHQNSAAPKQILTWRRFTTLV